MIIHESLQYEVWSELDGDYTRQSLWTSPNKADTERAAKYLNESKTMTEDGKKFIVVVVKTTREPME